MHLLIYCAGGFGREVMDIARRVNIANPRWEDIAFVDDISVDSHHYGAEVMSFGMAMERYALGACEVVIANGEPTVRTKLFEKVTASGIKLAVLVDPSAVISPSSLLEPGVIIFPNCYVSNQSTVGINSVVISGSMVGHNAMIGAHCVISGHVNIAGGCRVQDSVYVGMGSQVKENTVIARRTIVGMGSIVFKDLPESVVAMGNPCRPLQKNVDGKVF